MELISRFTHSIKDYGLKNSFYKIYARLYDKYFDIKNNVQTCGDEQLINLTIRSENKNNGTWYNPSRIIPLKKVLKKIDSPDTSILVDFGSGKGRVLLVALQAGFKEVHGVEFADELNRVAEQNLRKFTTDRPHLKYKIYNGDAAAYKIDEGENVFFFFNPFGEDIMIKVLKNITDSLIESPRDITIIYFHPKHLKVFENFPHFKLKDQFNFSEKSFLIFRN